MTDPQKLLERLDQIAQSLNSTGKAVALLGFGSVGVELDRLDEYSDLDFFAVVRAPHKGEFIANLDWLSRPAPLAYAFKNTPDGFKALYADGIFVEFAVFEPHDLEHIPYAEGRVVWALPEFDQNLRVPRSTSGVLHLPGQEHALGEALTNLYVGLGRYLRGEKLSAFRFIQGYALDRVMELIAYLNTPETGHADIFNRERRFEKRYPSAAALLPSMIQGYERTPDSAAAILEFLNTHFEVNQAMHAAITDLIAASKAKG